MKIKLPSTPNSFFLFFLIIVINSSSCKSKEEDIVSPVTATTCLLASIKSTNPEEYSDSTNYRFSPQGILIQSTWYSRGRERGVVDYEYNSLGKLIKRTSNEKYIDPFREFKIEITDILTYEYNGKGQIAKSTLVRTTPSWGSYYQEPTESIYEYDNQGNCTRVTTVSNPSLPKITEYTYLGSNCIKLVINPGELSEVVTLFEYDLSKEDKLQSFYQTFYQPFVFTVNNPNKNLIKKSIQTQTNNPSNFHNTQEYIYEYDKQGNVIKIEIEKESATQVKSSYKIFKKYTCQ